jgi:stage II sporulation protein AA (anti-sigma F factor antagonist)
MEKFYLEGPVLTYSMPKEVDHHVAKNLCMELDMLVEAYRAKELVLDFDGTEFMDSSGIGVVIGRSKHICYLGGKVSVKNLGSRVETIFRSAGLFKIVQLKED